MLHNVMYTSQHLTALPLTTPSPLSSPVPSKAPPKQSLMHSQVQVGASADLLMWDSDITNVVCLIQCHSPNSMSQLFSILIIGASADQDSNIPLITNIAC